MSEHRYYGMKSIGAIFGVNAATVSKWRTRYADTDTPCPKPAVWIDDVPGWDSEPAWKAWKISLPGRGRGGGPLPLSQAREELAAAEADARRQHPNDTVEWHHHRRAEERAAAHYGVDLHTFSAIFMKIADAEPSLPDDECAVRALATIIRSHRAQSTPSMPA